MVQVIENPDGSIAGEFPDDATPEEITQALNSELGLQDRRLEGNGQPQSTFDPLSDSAGVDQPPTSITGGDADGSPSSNQPAFLQSVDDFFLTDKKQRTGLGKPNIIPGIPGSNILGEVAAAFVPGLAALKAINLAVKVAPKVGKVIKAATTFSKGGGFKGLAANIFKAAAGGAAGGAATEVILRRDPVTGAIVGAAGGPIGLALGTTFKAAKAFIADPAAKGLIVIAKKIGIKPEEIGKRFLDFKAIMGRPPSIAEIVDDQSVAEIRNIISRTASATAIARESVEKISKTRAGEFAGVVSGGRVTTTATAQKARRSARADVQFAEVRDQDIVFSAEDAKDLLIDPDFTERVPSILRRQLDDIIDQASFIDDAGEVVLGEVTLSGKLVDDLRQVLAAAAKDGKGFRSRFLELKRGIEDVARENSPEFAQALDEFASRSARAKGVTTGRTLVKKDTSEAIAAVESAKSASERAGIRVGARSQLEDTAQEGLSRSAKLADDLARDEGLVARLSAVLPEAELVALQKAGAAEAKALRNIGNVAPNIKARGGKLVDNALNVAIGAVAVVGTNVGGAFKVGLANNLLNFLPPIITKKTRNNIARDILDPKKAQRVIETLKNMGLRDFEILDLFATSVAAGSQAAQIGK